MAHFDLSLDALWKYSPPHTRQPDFDRFWQETLDAAVQQPLNPLLEPLESPYRNVNLFRASFSGWGGASIVGVYATPLGDGPFPGVVLYHGYASRRPETFHLLGWILQGYAVLAIDIRGQSGESSDSGGYSGGHALGLLTLGIGDPRDYYYRGVYIDAVRAVDVLADLPEVDAARIGLAGASQGGALTLAAAALVGSRVRAAVAEIPFLCNFERAATLVDTEPYSEIGRYCRQSGADSALVFRTLSYFDCMNLTDRISAATLVTCGLMDDICPPSTIFAAYNAISAPKDIFVAPFGEHTTFPGVLDMRARWFAERLQPMP